MMGYRGEGVSMNGYHEAMLTKNLPFALSAKSLWGSTPEEGGSHKWVRRMEQDIGLKGKRALTASSSGKSHELFVNETPAQPIGSISLLRPLSSNLPVRLHGTGIGPRRMRTASSTS